MASAGPGLGAYIQAQKRQKQIEDKLAKAHKDDGDKDSGKKEDGDKKDGHEEQNTVSTMVKTAAKEVMATVKAVTATEDPNVSYIILIQQVRGMPCCVKPQLIALQACAACSPA